jgi:hypothetical protein
MARSSAVSGVMVTGGGISSFDTYVRISAISRPGPMMFMTRVRL